MTPTRYRTLTLALLLNLLLVDLAILPVAADSRRPPSEPAASEASTLDQFVASVSDGQAGVVRGVYVPGVLALKVLQQPEDQPIAVSRLKGAVTQYRYAQAGGVTGLLAHNTSSGWLFFNLQYEQEVWIVFGDGAKRGYWVTDVFHYQTLTPNDPYSDFADLNTGAVLSSGDLFEKMYWGGDRVTFQTCIAKNGNKMWGMLFVVAQPMESAPLTPLNERLGIE